MDHNETSEDIPEFDLGHEVIKTFALTAASTAGLLAGVMVIGATLTATQKFKENRKAKKLAKQTS